MSALLQDQVNEGKVDLSKPDIRSLGNSYRRNQSSKYGVKRNPTYHGDSKRLQVSQKVSYRDLLDEDLNWQQREMISSNRSNRMQSPKGTQRKFWNKRENVSTFRVAIFHGVQNLFLQRLSDNNSAKSMLHKAAPEWATDTTVNTTSFQDEAGDSSLNWQQQVILQRDDNDPFLSLVRGENEYVRE